MNPVKDISKIKKELIKFFPETEVIESEQQDSTIVELYFTKGKKLVLKFSKDYLEQNSFDEFRKHLQRNIYFVMKSNFNKTIYLMKNYGIEVEDLATA